MSYAVTCSQVVKAPAMQGKAIIFSTAPDTFQPLAVAEDSFESDSLECSRGVIGAGGKIR